ncbi:MAG: CARDB domain-containing protein [Candidatus Woesearchaeota archaeon]
MDKENMGVLYIIAIVACVAIIGLVVMVINVNNASKTLSDNYIGMAGQGTVTSSKIAPQTDSCEDTDNGIRIEIQGTTFGYYNGVGYNHTDYCQNNETVNEYFCNSTRELNGLYACGTDSYSPNYCYGNSVHRNFTDYFCLRGACGSQITQQFVMNCTYGCANGVCVNQTPSMPDLVILNASYINASYITNQSGNNSPLVVANLIKNKGNATTGTYFYLKVNINGTGGSYSLPNSYIPMLNPGQEYTAFVNAYINPGTYNYYGYVDSTYRISESNENNNEYIKTIYIP